MLNETLELGYDLSLGDCAHEPVHYLAVLEEDERILFFQIG